MKFTMLFYDRDEVRERYYKFRENGFGFGVRLMELRKCYSRDFDASQPSQNLLGYCCESSLPVYLYHKWRYGKYASVVKGWPRKEGAF